MFTTYSGEGGNNFCYINDRFIENSKYKVGLGKIIIILIFFIKNSYLLYYNFLSK